MLFDLTPTLLLANLIAIGIGMTVHEFAHNWVAHLMGDPVPAREGRLTLNPLVHINWIGWLMFAIIGFGILGSAPISPYRMRNPRWGFLAAVAAGPISNLLVAVVFALVCRIMGIGYIDYVRQDLVAVVLVDIVRLTVLLFTFNLIPLYPIDGWHIVHALLPSDLAYRWGSANWIRYSQYAFFALLLLSLSGVANILGWIIGVPTTNITLFLLNL